jgi:hypothetical protein
MGVAVMTDKTTPAFPIADPFIAMNPQTEKEAKLLQGGMTLRDYFAAKWLQGFMANPAVDDMTVNLCACKAYQMADAMMEARK